jgi:phosphatidyl-myo-inositol dimannoside synthase
MRVLLLSVDFAPHRDGVSTLSYHYARRLSELGHDVHVVGPRSSGDRELDASVPFAVSRFGGYSWGLLRWFPFVLRSAAVVRRFRPDVVLAMNIAYGGLLCGLLMPLRRPSYVTFAYAYEFLKFRRLPFVRRLYNAIYRRSLFVVAVSRYTGERLVDFGVSPERIHVVHPGVAGVRAAPRRAAGGGQPTLGTCGRLIRRKGHDLVIRALPLLDPKLSGTRYRIVGEGPERARLETLARELGVAERVEFLGSVPDAELPSFYASLDVFVMPSREEARSGHAEGFGIVYLEAAVHGVPSVGTLTGGIPEAIADGVTGRLVAAENVEELAGALSGMLGDLEATAELGCAARERAVQEFSWDGRVDRFAALLEGGLVEHGGATAPVPPGSREACSGNSASNGEDPGGSTGGLRVVVLTRTGRSSGMRLARAIERSGHNLCGVLAERRSSMIRRLVRRRGFATLLRTHGAGFLLSRLLGSLRCRGAAGTEGGTLQQPVTVVVALNSDRAVKLLQDWRPDLVVVANAPILQPRIISHGRLGAVNFHSGHLPEYGGLASEFWALYEGENEAWVTIHGVTEKLDSGDIMAECPVAIERGETPDSLHAKCIAAAERLLVETLDRFACGGAVPSRSPGPAVLRPWPTPAQRRELRRRQ